MPWAGAEGFCTGNRDLKIVPRASEARHISPASSPDARGTQRPGYMVLHLDFHEPRISARPGKRSGTYCESALRCSARASSSRATAIAGRRAGWTGCHSRTSTGQLCLHLRALHRRAGRSRGRAWRPASHRWRCGRVWIVPRRCRHACHRREAPHWPVARAAPVLGWRRRRALTSFFSVSSWGLRRIEWSVCEAIRNEERTLLITGTLLRRRWPLLFAFVVSAFSLTLAACGGDSESGGSPASQGGPGSGRGFAQDPEVRACLQKEGVTLPQGGRGRPPGGGARPDGSGRPTGTNAVPPTGTNARPPGGTDARPPGGAGRDPERFAKMRAALQKCGVEIGNGPPGGAPPNGAPTQTTPDAGS